MKVAARFASTSLLALALGAAWKSGAVTAGPVLCPFRLMTGLPCPGCGGTRAISALCAGDLTAAWALNPVILILAIATVAGFLFPSLGRSVRAQYVAAWERGWRVQLIAAVAVIYALLWWWNVSRW